MGKMYEGQQNQVSVLQKTLTTGGKVTMLIHAEGKLDVQVKDISSTSMTVEIKPINNAFKADTENEQTYKDRFVSLDADHMIHLHSVLNQHHRAIYQQLAVTGENLQGLYEEIEDNQRLRIRLENNRVTAQDLETLEILEQELEEIYGC